jgi:hypothetical protein
VVRTSENDIARAEAREIYISWSVPRPEGSLYILILPSISATIVFIELKTQKYNFFKETRNLNRNCKFKNKLNLTYRQMKIVKVLLIRIIESVLKFVLMLI